jgi:outer membrane protein insertion porin family
VAFPLILGAAAAVLFGAADLEYEGNETLWGFTLSRSIGEFEDRPLDPAAIDDAAFALERYYATRGFPFAEIAGKLEKNEDGEPVVRFRVAEGPRPVIDSIDFAGNERFDRETLDGLLGVREDAWYDASYVVEHALDDDAERLRNYYVAQGYVDVRVERNIAYDAGRERAHVFWVIDEGARYVVDGIEVHGNRTYRTAQIVSATAVRLGHDPWYPRLAIEVRDRIERHYKDRGFAFAVIGVEPVVDRKRARTKLRVRIVEGARWKFGRVVVSGRERTRRKLIEREFDFERGERYDQRKIVEAERELYALGLFDRVTVDVEPSTERPDEADLRVNVHETPAGSVRVGAGWGSFDQLRGQVGASYANLFGLGIQIDGRALASFRGYQLGAGLRDPFVFGTRIRFDLDLYLEDRDVNVYDIRRRGGTAFLSYPLSEHWRVATGMRLEHAEVADLQTGSLVTVESIDLVSSIVRFEHDTRDDPYDPEMGTYHAISYEEAGIFGWGQAEFSKLTVAGSYYWTPPARALRRLTIAMGIRAGIIYDHDGEEVPIQERFFLGGDTSLRGFEQNEVGEPPGGNVFLMASFEPRVRIYGPLAVAVFVDAGNILSRYSDFKAYDLRVTPGAGLRVKTPIGPLRLDVGVPVDKRSRDERENPEVHFSVGYPF